MSNEAKQRSPILLALFVSLLFISACSDSDGNAASDSASASASESASASASESGSSSESSSASASASASEPTDSGPYPVTLSQQLGEITIEAEPQTIVSTDLWSLDLLTELGVQPVQAHTFSPPPAWMADAAEGVEILTITDGFDIEAIAGAGPDLIVDGSGFATALDPDTAETLLQIAPVLSPPVDALSDRWDARIRHLGAAVGKSDEAEAIVEETTAAIAAELEAFPELQGAAVSFARFNAQDNTIDLIVDDSDFTRDFLNSELGFTTPEPQQEAFDDEVGGIIGGALNVSLELVELIGDGADAVVLFEAGPPGSLTDQDVWQALDFVQEDRVVVVTLDTVFAVRTPSPRSIDHVLAEVMPSLAAAVSGDGAGTVDTDGADAANVVEAAAAGGSTLIANFAAFSPDFAAAATGDGPVTVFMPSDATIFALQEEPLGAALQTDFALLDAVLQYHAVAGEALLAADVIAAGELITLSGEIITIEVDGDTVILNDGQATVSAADLTAPNGVAHVIEGLLLPADVAAEFGG